jgi:hypothetical protein
VVKPTVNTEESISIEHCKKTEKPGGQVIRDEQTRPTQKQKQAIEPEDGSQNQQGTETNPCIVVCAGTE